MSRAHSLLPTGLAASALLDDDLGKYGAAIARAYRERTSGAARHLEIRARARRVGGRDHGRPPAVGLLADAGIERQPPEKPHPVLRGHACPAAGAEYVIGVSTIRAD